MKSQQFVDDYLLVVENDQNAWLHHASIVKEENNVIWHVADRMNDEFLNFVSDLLDTKDPSHNDFRVNILREILLGWGTEPFENIAREIITRLEEGK